MDREMEKMGDPNGPNPLPVHVLDHIHTVIGTWNIRLLQGGGLTAACCTSELSMLKLVPQMVIDAMARRSETKHQLFEHN